MTLFETKTKSKRNSTKKRVEALKFGMAVTLKWYNVELQELQETATEPPLSPNCFFFAGSAVVAVSPTFLYSSTLYLFKANFIPKFSVVTFFKFLSFGFKKCHNRPLPYNNHHNFILFLIFIEKLLLNLDWIV